eukprot:GSA120T00012803001.1
MVLVDNVENLEAVGLDHSWQAGSQYFGAHGENRLEELGRRAFIFRRDSMAKPPALLQLSWARLDSEPMTAKQGAQG